MIDDLFAPEGGWRVRILDQSGALDDDIVEEIKGFPTLILANAFCRAYVRDSVEVCRAAGATGREVLAAWFAYGEDAEVIDAGEQGWKSANELDTFAGEPSGEIERDWRALDPRLVDPEDLESGAFDPGDGDLEPGDPDTDDADPEDDPDDNDDDDDPDDTRPEKPTP